MKWGAVRDLSNERLESEISNIYMIAYEAYGRQAVSVEAKEGSLLEALWAEYDARVADGLINDEDYWTGSELV